MSYLVLARKWRPRTFDAVVGQEHVTRTLKNAIELNRVAHALLFTGSRGIGKTSCARILAKALNCKEGPRPDPCGRCASCTEIEAGASVDVFEIDGASNNSVEQIREIRESVKFLPTAQGRRKMYIIDEVHMLSTSAFNALLKTLEEPPEHVLFVFATTEPHKIPDTIVSRCQRYDFKRIPERNIVEALSKVVQAEGIEAPEAALAHLAREAAGGMRDSLSLLDQVIAYCGMRISEERVREVLGIADRGTIVSMIDAIHAGDSQRVVALVSELFQAGVDLQKFTGELVRYLRDLMIVKICQTPSRLLDLSDDDLARMKTQAKIMAPAQIHRAFNALLKCAEDVSRSPFPKLVLEMGLLQVCAQGPALPISEALTALENIEAKLSQLDQRSAKGNFVEVQHQLNVEPPPAQRASHLPHNESNQESQAHQTEPERLVDAPVSREHVPPWEAIPTRNNPEEPQGVEGSSAAPIGSTPTEKKGEANDHTGPKNRAKKKEAAPPLYKIGTRHPKTSKKTLNVDQRPSRAIMMILVHHHPNRFPSLS